MAKNLSDVMKEMLKDAKGDPDLKNKNYDRLESLLEKISEGLDKLSQVGGCCHVSSDSLLKFLEKVEPALKDESFTVIQTGLSMMLTFGAIDSGMSKNAFLGYMDACYRKYKAEHDAREFKSDEDEDDDE
jgi:hypothetical protein